MRFVPFARCWGLGVVLSALFLGIVAILVDASVSRRFRDEASAQHDAIVLTTGLPDLALSSTARWLRHPSQAEPGAAVSDLPGSLDTEPAGSIVGPPLEVLGHETQLPPPDEVAP